MAASDFPHHQPIAHIWASHLWTQVGSEALAYLKGRGLTDQTIHEAGLGYVASQEEGWKRFQGSISIPYYDGRRREQGVRFRWLEESAWVKYDQRKGSPVRLYGYHLVEEPVIWFTEGEFDALILRQCGYPAIGVPGTSGWQDHWRWLFRDCSQAFVVFDGDDPGKSAALQVARSLSDVTRAEVIEPPPGKDVGQVFEEGGLEAIRRLLT